MLNESLVEGTGIIWLTDVQCTGNEKALMNCTANSSGVNSCTHAQDVGVRCPSGSYATSYSTSFISCGNHK